MKPKKWLISLLPLLIIIFLFLIIGITNKTFFNNYYKANNQGNKIKIPLPLFSFYEKSNQPSLVTFKTLRKHSNIRRFLNNYVENLQACYDESYFYDSELDITINHYHVENGFPFNKIYLSYSNGNYCENEFVLADNWVNDIMDNAIIKESVINKCIIENNNKDCVDKIVEISNSKSIFDYIYKDSTQRIKTKKNISLNENQNYYMLSIYYNLNSKAYMLSAFVNGNHLVFKITDSDDHSKNAVYDIEEDANKIFENIYNYQ